VTNRFVITAVGDDRPGIVAAVTGALLPVSANLEDTAMTLLEGQFAMVVVITLPEGDLASVRAALEPVSRDLDLMTDVRALGPAVAEPTGTACSLTVYGADRPGIVHRVTSTLAARGVNVVDLATRVIGRDGANPVYAMLLDLRLPDTVDEATVRADLDAVAGELGVDCTLRTVDADIF
jgi:glycine cleavage system transcriptional repressor